MHDIERVKRDLQESLSLNKGPVALLVGAGCPLSIRVPNATGGTDPLIPDVAGLTRHVQTLLASDSKFATLTAQFTLDNKINPTIEDLMSHVRLLRRIVGLGDARGLCAADLDYLDHALGNAVAAAVTKDLPTTDTPYHHLADWAGGTKRSAPLTLFTTNYDLLLEQALEERSLPVFDGFVGVRRPFFDLRAIEDDLLPSRWVRVWKIHGSINWRLASDGSVSRNQDVASAGALLIHPSELKYDQSRRMPYLAMIDRLRAFLRQPTACLVTVGYSFADEHLNEVVMQGLRSNPLAAGFGLLFGPVAREPGAAKIASRVPANLSLLMKDQGVLRGDMAAWMPDPAAAAGTTPPTSDLGDFAVFARFLRAMCAR